jgi:hypothetical protein
LKDALDVTIWTVDGVSGMSATDLASPAGAGYVGFSYAVGYAAGTVGKWLKDLATSAGAAFIGFIASGVNAVLRTVESKLRDVVSVIDYGADPTGIVDSTAAIQAAITALGVNGGEVFFPVGDYKVTAQINIPLATWKPVLLRGAANSTITSTHNGIVFNDSTENARYEHLQFVGPGKTNVSSKAIKGKFTQGWARGCKFIGYYLAIDASGTVGARIERNYFSSCHAGFNCEQASPAFSNLLQIVGNWFDFCDYGIFLVEVYGAVIDTNVFEFNSVGLSANNVRELDLRGNNWFESNTTKAFELLGSCTGVVAPQTHLVGNAYTISTTSVVNDMLTPQVALLRLSAVQSIPHNAATDVLWDVETLDPAGMHPAGASANVNISRTGLYDVTAVVQLAAVGAPAAGVYVRVTAKLNGATLREVSGTMNAAQPTQLGIAFSERFGNGDILQVAVYQNSGAAVNMLSGVASSFAVTFKVAV